MNSLEAVSIDDEEINLEILEEMSKETGVNITSFVNPLEAAEYVDGNSVDIAFVDYMMPEMNGIELIKHIKELHPDIPIVMITAISDNSNIKLNALKAGATEFLVKPIDAPDFVARVKNLVALRKAQLLLKDKARLLEDEVEKATKSIVEREYETLSVLGRAAEHRDTDTANHVTRVAHYSRMIAEALGEDEEFQDLIFYSAPLHDVGKIGISDTILLKPGKLTGDEFAIIETHSALGYNILKDTKSPYLQAGAIIALMHHEKFSGGGYPNSLIKDGIHIFGRIVAVADVFDALTTKRPYKEPWPIGRALELIIQEKNNQFDPEIVNAFLRNVDAVREIQEKFSD